jgi:hypothetical protein
MKLEIKGVAERQKGSYGARVYFKMRAVNYCGVEGAWGTAVVYERGSSGWTLVEQDWDELAS